MPNNSGGECVEQQSDEHNPDAQAVHPPAPPNNPSRTAANPIPSDAEKTEIQNLEDRMRRAEKWMVWLTAAIAFFGLCSVVVAVLQWRASENQGIDAHKLAVAASNQSDAASDMATAAGDQVDAGNNFADSAEQINRGVSGAVDQLQAAAKNTRTAIDNAQKAFRDEQRAWVGISDVKTIEFSENKPWNVGVIFTNSGRTPARNVQTSAGFRVSEVPISGPYPEDIKQLVFRPAQSIAPEAKFVHALGYFALGEARTPREMQGNQYLASKFQDIKSGKANVYYFGILKYDDIFGNPRETKFCIFLANPETQKAAFCDGFNDLN